MGSRDRSAATSGSTTGERERILAAVGWEEDPRRRPVLCALLREHLERIYLYAYAESRNRVTAIERSRRTLLSVARSLGSIPEGCSLTTWSFLKLEEERTRHEDIRALCRSLWEAGVSPESISTSGGPGKAPRTLVSLYERYLGLPRDEELRTRSGLKAALTDLDCFLDAQFGEGECAAPGNGPGWRQWFPSGFWRSSRMAALAIVVVGAVLAILLWRSWKVERPGSEPGASSPAPVEATTVPHPAAALGELRDAFVEYDGRSILFQWKAAATVGEYRIRVLTAKLDTLHTVDRILQAELRLDPASVPGLSVPGSYLFRVDAIREGHPTATTGLVPFELK